MKSNKVIVFVDKTRHTYQLDKTQYDKLLRDNITKHYKKADESTVCEINYELSNIANNLDIEDKIEVMAKKQAFITHKDHTENFENNQPCRLINPAKSNMGVISKQIIEKISSKVRSLNQANQWKNSYEVID